jgi:exonuclease SbcC
MISEQVVLSEQLVRIRKKTITELLKIHQFDSDSVQAILSKYGMSNWKRQKKQFAVDLKWRRIQ